jgi:hypothetical protein
LLAILAVVSLDGISPYKLGFEYEKLCNLLVILSVIEPKEPRKKKYAKEAWPGKKPMHSFLV